MKYKYFLIIFKGLLFAKKCLRPESASLNNYHRDNPGNIYLFKVNNSNSRKRCEICSELTIKTPFSSVAVVDSEHVNVSSEGVYHKQINTSNPEITTLTDIDL